MALKHSRFNNTQLANFEYALGDYNAGKLTLSDDSVTIWELEAHADMPSGHITLGVSLIPDDDIYYEFSNSDTSAIDADSFYLIGNESTYTLPVPWENFSDDDTVYLHLKRKNSTTTTVLRKEH